MSRNELGKHALVWFLLASPIWWTAGCSMSEDVTKPSPTEDEEIEIDTHSRTYFLTGWQTDSLGTFYGKARWKNPKHIWFGDSQPRYLYIEGKFSIPKDSILAVRANRIEVGQTILAFFGILSFSLLFLGLVVKATGGI